MSNATYSSGAFKRANSQTAGGLMRELFAATPLYIFYTALKSAVATR
jgi:hypothetical protein